MSTHSQPPVGIDHPTVVPANSDPEDADESLDVDERSADTDDPTDATGDGRAER